jgi:hypothetical protein
MIKQIERNSIALQSPRLSQRPLRITIEKRHWRRLLSQNSIRHPKLASIAPAKKYPAAISPKKLARTMTPSGGRLRAGAAARAD